MAPRDTSEATRRGERLRQLVGGLGNEPPPALFRATALPNIWTGATAGCAVILKRSRRPCEALVYRYLVQAHGLPGPGLLHASEAADGDGCWLLLEPVACTPPGLSPRSATHWWQNPLRRDRAVIRLAAVHAQFWNRPELVDDFDWLRRYEADDFWTALDQLTAVDGHAPLSGQLLGQLASAAEMLVAGPESLIHGSFTVDNVGWHGDEPVFLDWERAAWATPYADLGRLFTRFEVVDGTPVWTTHAAWRGQLLDSYRAAIEAVAGVRLDLHALALDVRNAMLWELAVDLLRLRRRPDEPAREEDERTLGLLENLADQP
jgi:hypothetical protein